MYPILISGTFQLPNCNMASGKAVGDYSRFLDDTKSVEGCLLLVTHMEPTANGISYSNGRCDAKFGATHIEENTAWQSCIFGGRLMLHYANISL